MVLTGLSADRGVDFWVSGYVFLVLIGKIRRWVLERLIRPDLRLLMRLVV